MLVDERQKKKKVQQEQAPGDFYIFSLSLEGPLMSDDSLLTKEKMKRLSPSDTKTFSEYFPGYSVTAS